MDKIEKEKIYGRISLFRNPPTPSKLFKTGTIVLLTSAIAGMSLISAIENNKKAPVLPDDVITHSIVYEAKAGEDYTDIAHKFYDDLEKDQLKFNKYEDWIEVLNKDKNGVREGDSINVPNVFDDNSENLYNHIQSLKEELKTVQYHYDYRTIQDGEHDLYSIAEHTVANGNQIRECMNMIRKENKFQNDIIRGGVYYYIPQKRYFQLKEAIEELEEKLEESLQNEEYGKTR